MGNFDFEIECVTVKILHEALHARGNETPPMFSIFKDGLRVAALLCRNLQSDVADDKIEAYKEMFSLVATAEADRCFFACDAWFAMQDNPDNIIRPSEHPHRMETFICLTMKRGDEAVQQKSMPYIQDCHGRIYYVLSDRIGGTELLAEGLVPELLQRAFMIPKADSPFETVEEHAQTLKTLGHNVATWKNGNGQGQMRLY
jgi:hypothetical protein